MTDQKVLTPTEVASYREYPGLKLLCNSHETLRAELDEADGLVVETTGMLYGEQAVVMILEATITRLRGLIEALPHEPKCRRLLPLPFGDKARAEFDGKCNCIKSKSKVNL